MEEITLDTLIKEGQKHRSSMKASMHGWSHADNTQFSIWMETSKRFVLREFKEDILSDNFELEVINYKDNRVSANNVDRLLSTLMACKNIPERILKKKKDPAIGTQINNNLTNTQSQQQSQYIELFIEAIKDEITGKQLKELKQIVSEEKDIEKARPKILDKIKSFGLDTLSNIVANIATNPNIFTAF